MNYYKRHLGDYAKDTSGLTMTEHGAFTLLLDLYYASEQAFDKEDAMRVCRPSSPSEAKAVEYVLRKFFIVDDAGLYRNERADAEIQKAHAKAESNREVGKKGGRPAKSGNPKETMMVSGSNQEETQTVPKNNPSHYSTTPLLQKSEEQVHRPADAGPLPDRFAEFWQAYPDKTGRKPCAEKWKAKRLNAEADRIIADVRARAANDRKWLDGFIPNPLTYLNQERWNDPIQPRGSGPPAGPMGKQMSGVLALLEQANGSVDSAGSVNRVSEVVRLEPRRLPSGGVADDDRQSVG